MHPARVTPYHAPAVCSLFLVADLFFVAPTLISRDVYASLLIRVSATWCAPTVLGPLACMHCAPIRFAMERLVSTWLTLGFGSQAGTSLGVEPEQKSPGSRLEICRRPETGLVSVGNLRAVNCRALRGQKRWLLLTRFPQVAAASTKKTATSRSVAYLHKRAHLLQHGVPTCHDH